MLRSDVIGVSTGVRPSFTRWIFGNVSGVTRRQFSSVQRRQVSGVIRDPSLSFKEAIHTGFSKTPKRLSPSLLYDKRGSQLFDKICQTPEYYVTRTELEIMHGISDEIAQAIGPNTQIVELGAGNNVKIRILLDALNQPHSYIPVDVSGSFLESELAPLRRDYPDIHISSIHADFTHPFEIPMIGDRRPPDGRLLYFPGSTIGNFKSTDAITFLQKLSLMLHDVANSGILIGVDLAKSETELNAAYNDSKGITKKFIFNVLDRINCKLGADIDTNSFEYLGHWQKDNMRMELSIISRIEQTVNIGDQAYQLNADEKIHVEYSYKYTLDAFKRIVERAGMRVDKVWTDPSQRFSVQMLRSGRHNGKKKLIYDSGRFLTSDGKFVNTRHNDLTNACLMPDVAQSISRVKTVILSEGESDQVRDAIKRYFNKTFTLFEHSHEIFNCSEAFFFNHDHRRAPPIFYLAQTAAFYITKFLSGGYLQEGIDEDLERETDRGFFDRENDTMDSEQCRWPTTEEVVNDVHYAETFLQKILDYRFRVQEKVNELIDTMPLDIPITKDSFWWAMMMGIEHERVHLEKSSINHRNAPLHMMKETPLFPACTFGNFNTVPKSDVARSSPKNHLIKVTSGEVLLGVPWEGTPLYGWDNEFSGTGQRISVKTFKAAQYLTSNYEYLEFLKSGGYQNKHWWTDEGWKWVVKTNPTAPKFWLVDYCRYKLRLINVEVPMPWDWPVEVNHHEATAFCNYKSENSGVSLRLPSEAENMLLRKLIPADIQETKDGKVLSNIPGNKGLEFGSPCPVDMFTITENGFSDIVGNVWRHLRTPFMEHSRNWSKRGFYQHAGFRYVESIM